MLKDFQASKMFTMLSNATKNQPDSQGGWGRLRSFDRKLGAS